MQVTEASNHIIHDAVSFKIRFDHLRLNYFKSFQVFNFNQVFKTVNLSLKPTETLDEKLSFETQLGTEEIGSYAQSLDPPTAYSRDFNLKLHNVPTAPIADIVVMPISQLPPTHGLRHPVEGGTATLEGTQGTAREPLE